MHQLTYLLSLILCTFVFFFVQKALNKYLTHINPFLQNLFYSSCRIWTFSKAFLISSSKCPQHTLSLRTEAWWLIISTCSPEPCFVCTLAFPSFFPSVGSACHSSFLFFPFLWVQLYVSLKIKIFIKASFSASEIVSYPCCVYWRLFLLKLL